MFDDPELNQALGVLFDKPVPPPHQKPMSYPPKPPGHPAVVAREDDGDVLRVDFQRRRG